MIDQGFCFNRRRVELSGRAAVRRYARHRVYESVQGLETFEPWIARIEKFDVAAVEEASSEIPPEWLGEDPGALERLLEQLLRRRSLVRELIVSAWKSSAQPFPNWK